MLEIRLFCFIYYKERFYDYLEIEGVLVNFSFLIIFIKVLGMLVKYFGVFSLV